jgi:hypothetical protein
MSAYADVLKLVSSETKTWHGVKLGVAQFIKEKPSFRGEKTSV